MNQYNHCKVCNASVDLVNQHFNLVQCKNCGLIFCNDIFTEEFIRKTYYDLYNKSDKYQPYQSQFARLKNAKSIILGWPRRRVLKYILKNDSKVIGEVGAGVGTIGSYLSKFSHINYTGIEMDHVTAEKAASLGINIRTGSFTLLKEYTNHFDALIGFEVIEHIQELDQFLNLAHVSLRTGGLLGFSVPNYSKILNYPLGSEKLHQDGPPVHINFFTRESIEKVFLNSGFRIRFIDFKKRPYFNYKKIDTYKFLLKALVGKYYGPTIVGVVEKA